MTETLHPPPHPPTHLVFIYALISASVKQSCSPSPPRAVANARPPINAGRQAPHHPERNWPSGICTHTLTRTSLAANSSRPIKHGQHTHPALSSRRRPRPYQPRTAFIHALLITSLTPASYTPFPQTVIFLIIISSSTVREAFGKHKREFVICFPAKRR